MRKFLFFTVVFFAILLVNPLSAQVKGGFKMGMDLSTVTFDGEKYEDSDRLISPRLGVVMEIPVYEGIFIEPGIFGSARGYRFDWEREVKENEWKESREFYVIVCVDMPINIGYKYDFDAVSVFGKVGPVFSVNTYNTDLYRVDGEWDNEHLTVGTGPDDFVKPFTMYFNAEAGVQLDRFQLSVSYMQGLSEMSPNDLKMKSNVISINAAVLFGKFGNNSGYGRR